MPANNVDVICSFENILYDIDLDTQIDNGVISASVISANVGTEVVLTITPSDGYQIQAGTLTVMRFDRYNS